MVRGTLGGTPDRNLTLRQPGRCIRQTMTSEKSFKPRKRTNGQDLLRPSLSLQDQQIVPGTQTSVRNHSKGNWQRLLLGLLISGALSASAQEQKAPRAMLVATPNVQMQKAPQATLVATPNSQVRRVLRATLVATPTVGAIERSLCAASLRSLNPFISRRDKATKHGLRVQRNDKRHPVKQVPPE
jgi:hypothetical protein